MANVALSASGSATTDVDALHMNADEQERFRRIMDSKAKTAVALRQFEKEEKLLHERLMQIPEYRKKEQLKAKRRMIRKAEQESNVELEGLVREAHRKSGRKGRLVDYLDETIDLPQQKQQRIGRKK